MHVELKIDYDVQIWKLFFLPKQTPSPEKSWIVQHSIPENMKNLFDGGHDMSCILMPFHNYYISSIKGAI